MSVYHLRPTSSDPDPTVRNTGIGEALAFRIMRLCVTTMWSDEVKKKAGVTPQKMRAELAKIIFEIQRLKRHSSNGSAKATLELVSFVSTLDMFENNMFRADILGVDRR